MTDAINTGMILEALNDKVDRDCRNVDTTSGADSVIEWQAPTAENNYTWYRLYKSGWVEQGGVASVTDYGGSVTLPIEMSDTYYTAIAQANKNARQDGANANCFAIPVSATQITVGSGYNSNQPTSWVVFGMAAQS